MKSQIAAGNVSSASGNFSAVSKDDYRKALLSGEAAISAVNQIGALTPVFIYNDSAEYYFTGSINGETITFPVEFTRENGEWKIREF